MSLGSPRQLVFSPADIRSGTRQPGQSRYDRSSSRGVASKPFHNATSARLVGTATSPSLASSASPVSAWASAQSLRTTSGTTQHRASSARQRLTPFDSSSTSISALERRVEGLSGEVKSLSDELFQQMQWGEELKGQFLDWRTGLEEQTQMRFAVLERRMLEHVARVETAANAEMAGLEVRCQAAAEGQPQLADLAAAVCRTEGLLEEVAGLEGRLQSVEDTLRALLTACQRRDSDVEAFVECGRQLTELRQQVEMLIQEGRGCEARLEEHEGRLCAVRSRLDGQGESYTEFQERVRVELDGRFRRLDRLVQDTSTKQVDHDERLTSVECLGRRLRVLDDCANADGAGSNLRSTRSPILDVGAEGLDVRF